MATGLVAILVIKDLQYPKEVISMSELSAL